MTTNPSASAESGVVPPRGYIAIKAACVILTGGGTERALVAADEYLRLVVGSQGITGAGTAVPGVRLRWRHDGGELQVCLHDLDALRDHFDRWIGDVVPKDERTASPTPAVFLDPDAGPAAASEAPRAAGRSADALEPDKPRTVEAEFRVWLSSQVTADVKAAAALGKSRWHERARQKFPTLSGNAFDHAWGTVAGEYPEIRKAGRKRGSPAKLVRRFR